MSCISSRLSCPYTTWISLSAGSKKVKLGFHKYILNIHFKLMNKFCPIICHIHFIAWMKFLRVLSCAYAFDHKFIIYIQVFQISRIADDSCARVLCFVETKTNGFFIWKQTFQKVSLFWNLPSTRHESATERLCRSMVKRCFLSTWEIWLAFLRKSSLTFIFLKSFMIVSKLVSRMSDSPLRFRAKKRNTKYDSMLHSICFKMKSWLYEITISKAVTVYFSLTRSWIYKYTSKTTFCSWYSTTSTFESSIWLRR